MCLAVPSRALSRACSHSTEYNFLSSEKRAVKLLALHSKKLACFQQIGQCPEDPHFGNIRLGPEEQLPRCLGSTRDWRAIPDVALQHSTFLDF